MDQWWAAILKEDPEPFADIMDCLELKKVGPERLDPEVLTLAKIDQKCVVSVYPEQEVGVHRQRYVDYTVLKILLWHVLNSCHDSQPIMNLYLPDQPITSVR